jgi:hypothetical protein
LLYVLTIVDDRFRHSKNFIKCALEYNNLFSFGSEAVKSDPNLPAWRRKTVIKINNNIHYYLSSFVPYSNDAPVFGSIYTMGPNDLESELEPVPEFQTDSQHITLPIPVAEDQVRRVQAQRNRRIAIANRLYPDVFFDVFFKLLFFILVNF